ncbi:TetR/AcrR family transcriptional regulator [Pseudoalteromonas ruthenica]|uniref:TetR/AcrR family transcriptional regulator n=1 Tax=Pseudoalteromonas ruthenica TaxID=151081 RepID=UPI001247E45E|nr:TetR/AcrR family transcriptional regulator [Pseudoalteromonas ruthenica]
MAWHPEHKKNSKNRILTSAANLFSQHGYDKVAIDDVMGAAQLTRGAFYSHFKSKSELYSKALIHAAKLRANQVNDSYDAEDIRQFYLADEHVNAEHAGCPLAFLVSDISHRDEQVRATYTAVLNNTLTKLENTGLTRTAAIHQALMMIATVAVSRAITDESLKEELLTVGRQSPQHE